MSLVQEHRDHYFGRLFGAEAIIESSIIFEPSVPFSCWTRLLRLILDLAKDKPWIREECGWIIYQSIYDLSAKQADVKFVHAALEQLCLNNLARTPEGISIWLASDDLFPSARLPGIWKHDDPLDSSNSDALAEIMKESSSPDRSNENGKQRSNNGVWNSKLHFAWNAVLTRLSDGSKNRGSEEKTSSSPRRLNFADFWADVVDGEHVLWAIRIGEN